MRNIAALELKPDSFVELAPPTYTKAKQASGAQAASPGADAKKAAYLDEQKRQRAVQVDSLPRQVDPGFESAWLSTFQPVESKYIPFQRSGVFFQMFLSTCCTPYLRSG